MKDLRIELENRPGALASAGEALAQAGISIEGGGAWVCGGNAVAHFLVEDADKAVAALRQAGIGSVTPSAVLLQRLNQDVPGQLGAICRRFAEAGVNIDVQYSDHCGQLVLVVDNMVKGSEMSDDWKQEHKPQGAKADSRTTKEHTYGVSIEWTGNSGAGTTSYTSYSRDHLVSAAGKQAIEASSDPAFRGDPSRYNPEELMLASLSSCHMLWYLHLCSARGISVVEYRDSASGTLELTANGAGQFARVELQPQVTIAQGSDSKLAAALHQQAHQFCFIARSVNFPVEISPMVSEAAPDYADEPTT
jgi:organic hydroperoxide reductase OsmC/OhrA